MNKPNKIYLCIDLKSFYASVECALRNLDSLKTDLVVADASNGQGAICLAVSVSLKEKGVKNRCRLYEIPKNLNYIIAKPRMKKYIEYSANIYGIYLKYVAPEDIFVYSIDECFLDITPYISLYSKNAYEIALMIIEDVYKQTKIRATAGIGTNLFLAKVALDIKAKHSLNYIGYVDLKTFKEEIAFHRPITDIWNIGSKIAYRLATKFNVFDLDALSKVEPKLLYDEFGVNAEILIDHSKGIEPTTIQDILAYKPEHQSLSSGQILPTNYNFDEALIILKEMVDSLVSELVSKEMAISGISLGVSYGDKVTKSTNASLTLDVITSSLKDIRDYFIYLYQNKVSKVHPIRQIGISLNGLVSNTLETTNLFTDETFKEKEKKLQKTILEIQNKYGKNAILKGLDLHPKATTRKRNKQIGGHNSE